MKTKSKVQCVVCGARLKSLRFGGADTCDPTCYKAKTSGRTRGEQQTFEIRRAQVEWEQEDHNQQQFRHERSINTSGLDYNRPYMMEPAV